MSFQTVPIQPLFFVQRCADIVFFVPFITIITSHHLSTIAQAVQRSLLNQQVAQLVQAVVSQPTFPEILAAAVLEAYPTEGGAAIQPARYVL